MTKEDLLETIINDTHLPRRQVERMYRSLVRTTKQALEEGERVHLSGLGSFHQAKSSNGYRYIKFKVYRSFRRKVSRNGTPLKVEERLIYGLPVR